MGDITGDLASRRGQVTGTANMAGGMMIISGTVPLSELDGYAARLNAITQVPAATLWNWPDTLLFRCSARLSWPPTITGRMKTNNPVLTE